MRFMIRLMLLERRARHAERLRFRQRLTSNVLTIAEIMEVQSTTAAQRQACAALRQQAVMQYDPEALGEQQECCICSSEFNAMEEISRALCGHVFHSECLGRWLQRSLTCPLCRGQLATNPLPRAPRDADNNFAVAGAELAQMVGAAV